MDVGVGRALDVSVRRGRERELLQEIPTRFDQGQHGDEHGEMDLDRRSNPRSDSRAADPTVQVVEDPDCDGDQEKRDQQPAHEELQEGKIEDIEADVLVELRISGFERSSVGEQQPVLPLADGAGSGAEAEDDRYSEVEAPRVGSNGLLVAADHLVIGIGHVSTARNPTHQKKVSPQHEEECHAEHQHQADLDTEQGGEHAALAD